MRCMAKFKAGDRVRIIYNGPELRSTEHAPAFVSDMCGKAGRVVTIKDINSKGYWLKEVAFNWHESWLAPHVIESAADLEALYG